MQTQKRARSAKKSDFSAGPKNWAARVTYQEYSYSSLNSVRKEKIHHLNHHSGFIPHRSRTRQPLTPTMLNSSSPMLELIKFKIYGRYVPISPSYDPNEFVHFYNKKSHQNFANFDRPEKGRINEFFNSFFEIGYSSTRSCQQQRQQTNGARACAGPEQPRESANSSAACDLRAVRTPGEKCKRGSCEPSKRRDGALKLSGATVD